MRQLQAENAGIALYDFLLCSADVVQDGIPVDICFKLLLNC